MAQAGRGRGEGRRRRVPALRHEPGDPGRTRRHWWLRTPPTCLPRAWCAASWRHSIATRQSRPGRAARGARAVRRLADRRPGRPRHRRSPSRGSGGRRLSRRSASRGDAGRPGPAHRASCGDARHGGRRPACAARGRLRSRARRARRPVPDGRHQDARHPTAAPRGDRLVPGRPGLDGFRGPAGLPPRRARRPPACPGPGRRPGRRVARAHPRPDRGSTWAFGAAQRCPRGRPRTVRRHPRRRRHGDGRLGHHLRHARTCCSRTGSTQPRRTPRSRRGGGRHPAGPGDVSGLSRCSPTRLAGPVLH